MLKVAGVLLCWCCTSYGFCNKYKFYLVKSKDACLDLLRNGFLDIVTGKRNTKTKKSKTNKPSYPIYLTGRRCGIKVIAFQARDKESDTDSWVK